MIRITVKKRLAMADGPRVLSVNTEIATGEFLGVFGASGAGKTSLLRMIAGLLKPETGKIEWDDEIWLDTENKINKPIQKREIGFVFQDLALFPNMSVKENMVFAAGKNKDEDYLSRLLQMTGLSSMSERKPQTLSGGQQQRAAIIRALARKPRLLLLDEPFSSLDKEMHHRLREELKAIHHEFKLTTLLVSHAIEDMYDAADRIMEIRDGVINVKEIPNERSAKDRSTGKHCFRGEVIGIHKSTSGFILEILAEETILRLPATEEDVTNLKPGMMISISSYSRIQKI